MIPTKWLERDKWLDSKRVNPKFARLAKVVLADMRKKGYYAVLTEVERTPAKAALMKLTGKSLNGTLSYHVYQANRLVAAMDIIFWDGKKLTYNVPNAYWEYYGSMCRSVGLTWGGTWKKLVDKCHCQLDK